MNWRRSDGLRFTIMVVLAVLLAMAGVLFWMDLTS